MQDGTTALKLGFSLSVEDRPRSQSGTALIRATSGPTGAIVAAMLHFL